MKRLLFIVALVSLTSFVNAQTAYITNANDSTVFVIDVATNTVIDTIKVGDSPWGVAVSNDGSKVYITLAGSDSVSVINTSTDTILASIKVGVDPRSLEAVK